MDSAQRDLLYLFERPYDPVNRPRANGSFVYEVDNMPAVTTRFGGSGPTTSVRIPSRPDADPSRLGTATSIPRGKPFSFFLRSHRRAAKDLTDAFMRTRGTEDLVQYAASVQGQVNEGLFIFALSFVILRKPELRSVRLPSIVEVFPNKFVPQEELGKMQIEANRVDPNQKMPLIIEYGPEFSSTNLKAEHRVSYWREDYGVNSHHWHWHLVYPFDMGVKGDRKGEVFYYMHQQVVARYDMERLSVGLNRVTKLENWREPIPDGYFPKLTVNNSGKAWGTRQDNTPIKDFRRNDFGLDFADITDMENWRKNIWDAIHQGFMVNRQGERIPLSDNVTSGKRGIDILGDVFEADFQLSVNLQLYGDLHNMGHVFVAAAHDPDYSHKEELGVMSDPATSMRDPVFWRWHKFTDDAFQEYKMTQPPYTQDDLSLPGVVLERVGVVRNTVANNLTTFWNTKEFEASRGLDFNSPVPVILRLTHLDHAPFNYHLQVINRQSGQKQVTVRIFMAPKHNERGLEMSFMDQRLLWAEMDKFTVSLKPGSNHVVRSSKDSSITNPNEYTFRDLEQGLPGQPGRPGNDEFTFCGCGWPEHLLLPRGRPEGMAYQLFFMITDYEKDKVDQPPAPRRCTNAVSFCGILDAKFPDSRPMGFPFDRRPPPVFLNAEVTSAADYAKLDNIMLHDITITFLGNRRQ